MFSFRVFDVSIRGKGVQVFVCGMVTGLGNVVGLGGESVGVEGVCSAAVMKIFTWLTFLRNLLFSFLIVS